MLVRRAARLARLARGLTNAAGGGPTASPVPATPGLMILVP